jgi:hypothetical protein
MNGKPLLEVLNAIRDDEYHLMYVKYVQLLHILIFAKSCFIILVTRGFPFWFWILKKFKEKPVKCVKNNSSLRY